MNTSVVWTVLLDGKNFLCRYVNLVPYDAREDRVHESIQSIHEVYPRAETPIVSTLWKQVLTLPLAVLDLVTLCDTWPQDGENICNYLKYNNLVLI